MTDIVWRVLDREAEVDVTHRQLPHWDQTGALTFVTFRLADSMPRKVLEQWDAEQLDWLRRNYIEERARRLGESSNSIDVSVALKEGTLPEPMRLDLLKFRKRRWHSHLDACHGRCLLRDPRHAQVVVDSLLKFNGERYDLERFIVMPNHVHLLVQMDGGFKLREQCERWLRYTGRQINQATGDRGEFWQSEPFDHVVRSAAQFKYLQQYIAENAQKARLKDGDYLFWKRA